MVGILPDLGAHERRAATVLISFPSDT